MSKKTATAIAGGVLLLILWIGSAGLNWASCAWYGYQTDRTVRYAAFTGCLVKMPTGWTPRYELRTEQ